MNANDRVALVIGKLTIRNADIEAQLEAQAKENEALKAEIETLKKKDNAAD